MHYPQLQSFYEKYNSQGLEVVAFPCNQFKNQEPGSNAEIKAYVQSKFGITFQMMSKINVNGNEAHPIYKWMKSTKVGAGRSISWNYTNFIIDRCGMVRKRHEPLVVPNLWENEIVELLNETPNCL